MGIITGETEARLLSRVARPDGGQAGKLVSAYFGLLDKLQLVTPPEQLRPHSVLLTPATEFVIYMPPR